jgi:glycosyltransferase involved in cell wall biosynthesis
MNPLNSATGQNTGMEVIVLDNGFRSRGEHSYRLLLEVGEALSRRKIAHRIFGVRDADASAVADIGAIPWFTKSLYWSGRQGLPSLRNFASDSLSLMRSFGARGYHFSEEATSRVLNKAYRRDLKRLPSDVWAPDNLIVVPAITQNQIFGLVQHLLTLPASAQPTVVCQLMFTPTWTPWNRNGCHGEDYYQQAFRLAAPLIGKSLFFTTENDALAQVYLQVFNLKTGLLPIVTQMPHAAPQPESTIKLGFFGYSKSEKGFHLLPEAIELCRARNLPAQFVVQIQHTNWEYETVETEKVLRQIPDLEIIDGALDADEYARHINEVDATLLPYDPVRFGLRGSGIYTESVAAGRPVVAAKGIYAALGIERGEAMGEIFAPYTGRALADAIERLLPRVTEFQSRAARGARDFAARQTGDAYIDAMLRFAQRRETSNAEL